MFEVRYALVACGSYVRSPLPSVRRLQPEARGVVDRTNRVVPPENTSCRAAMAASGGSNHIDEARVKHVNRQKVYIEETPARGDTHATLHKEES